MYSLSPQKTKRYLEKMKNKLKSDGYRIKFWYERDKKNRPIITKCKIYKIGEDKTYFGSSICDKYDIPSKNNGKFIALSRAVKALRNNETKKFYASDKIMYGVFNYRKKPNPDYNIKDVEKNTILLS